MKNFLDSLYSDVGNKIKTIVKWSFLVTVVVITVAAILFMIYALGVLLFGGDATAFIALILTPVAWAISICAIWFSSLPLFCVGEITNKIVKIEEKSNTNNTTFENINNANINNSHTSSTVDKGNIKLNNILSGKKENNTNKDEHWICKSCGCKNPSDKTKCWSCEAHR